MWSTCSFPSMLVEKGGTLQAGSACNPFGKQGGNLKIGIFGTDPSDEGRLPPASPAIQCQTAPKSQYPLLPRHPRLPAQHLLLHAAQHRRPVRLEDRAGDQPAQLFARRTYGKLNFDPTSFGYKVLGVAYGGTLNLFGWKGALPLQSPDGRQDRRSARTSTAPCRRTPALDTDRDAGLGRLTGDSWARLNGISADRTMITLDRDVSADWTMGDQIVVGTTDWYPSHSELRSIKSLASVEMAAAPATRNCRTLDRAPWTIHTTRRSSAPTISAPRSPGR